MANTKSNADIDKRFYEEYTVGMIKRGRLTTLIAALLTFLPALYLWLALGFKPTWNQIAEGWFIICSSYFGRSCAEPPGFYPIMGLSGIYIGYLAGNIPSVRLPAMLSAQAAVNAPAGTKKGELVGTIAIGMSVFVNLAFVTLAAVAGVGILNILPEFVINAFDYTLPAILGGVMAQYFRSNKVFVPIILVICIILQKAPIPTITQFPGAIISGFLIGLYMYRRKKKREEQA